MAEWCRIAPLSMGEWAHESTNSGAGSGSRRSALRCTRSAVASSSRIGVKQATLKWTQRSNNRLITHSHSHVRCAPAASRQSIIPVAIAEPPPDPSSAEALRRHLHAALRHSNTQMYERLQQRLAETANAAAATAAGAAGAAPAANARPRRLSIGTNGAGLGAMPAPPAALVAPAVAPGMARAPLSLYPFPSSAFGAAAPMPAPVPAVASNGVAPSPSLPASASTSAHHAALICNTCSRAPVKNSSFNAVTGQIVQAVTLARCSGCRAVYCQHRLAQHRPGCRLLVANLRTHPQHCQHAHSRM